MHRQSYFYVVSFFVSVKKHFRKKRDLNFNLSKNTKHAKAKMKVEKRIGAWVKSEFEYTLFLPFHVS